MAYQDLRDFIGRLENDGELHRVQAEVNWEHEIGCIARRVKDLRAPCPLFENRSEERRVGKECRL